MVLLFSLIAGIFFFIALGIIFFRIGIVTKKVDVTVRLRPYIERQDVQAASHRKTANQILETIIRIVHPLGAGIVRLPQTVTMEQRMKQADLPFRGSDFIVLLCLIGFVVWIIAGILFQNLLLGCLIGLIAIVSCFFWLHLYIQRRRAAFANQLGDALIMTANALRAGFSFNQTMALIGREMSPPISVEFTKTVVEMQLGTGLETAMEHMGQRMPSKDLDLVITAVLIQNQVGGNLSQILDIVAQTLMERVRMKREIKALTAQGRMSGYVVAALPFAFAGLITMINPDFMKPMFMLPLGRVLIGVGIFLDCAGLFVIHKMVNIDM